MSGHSGSRTLRKFLRHKPAVVSLVVICIYGLVAVVLLTTNWITLDETTERVGPKQIPGFGLKSDAEKRFLDAENIILHIESLTERRKPGAALESFNYLGVRKIAQVSVEELKERIEACWEIFDELAELNELNLIVNGTSDEAGAAKAESVLSDLNELDERIENLLAPMSEQEASIRRTQLLLGTDRQGRSIFLRGVYSIRVAILVGLVTGVLSVTIGTALGLMAGFFGGWVDHAVTWLYSTFASIPNIVLLILLAFTFEGGHIDDTINTWTGGLLTKLIGSRLDETLIPVYIALTATFWIGPCRVIRGETLKLRELEYVQAATVMGFGRTRILLRHILPNVTHLMLINFSLLFIGAIKTEVILSYLSLGVKKGPSWGLMISQSGAEVVNGFFWQIGTATALMFCLVLAFNILSDAMQDILDPKHVA